MKKFSLLGIAGILAAFCIVVAAQVPQSSQSSESTQTPGPRGQRVQRGTRDANRSRHFDTNMDGKISRDEWRGKPELFDQLDSNKDGSLDREELRSAMRRHKNREGSGDAFKR